VCDFLTDVSGSAAIGGAIRQEAEEPRPCRSRGMWDCSQTMISLYGGGNHHDSLSSRHIANALYQPQVHDFVYAEGQLSAWARPYPIDAIPPVKWPYLAAMQIITAGKMESSRMRSDSREGSLISAGSNG
jgi:hypothetical protein